MATNNEQTPIRSKVKTKRPLRDQSFFLYLKHRNIDEIKLQKSIERLGGRLDKFFSKDITCLLVDDDYGSQCSGLEPSTSPQITSPNTESERPSVLTPYSRGLSLLRRSKVNVDREDSTNSFRSKQTVMDKAQLWGIKITRITKFMEWIKGQMVKQKKSVENCKNNEKEIITLTAPFIKIEDASRKYQPQYRIFVNEPHLFFEAGYCESPFDSLPEPQNCKKLKEDRSSHEANRTKSVLEGVTTKERCKVRGMKNYSKVTKPQKHHYCECCKCTFYNLNHHINEAKHQKFVQNSENYDCVLDIIKSLPSIDEFKSRNTKSVEK